MTESGVAAVAVVAASAGGAAIGIDTDALIWGLGGGLSMLSTQPPMNPVRAASVVATAAMVAAAFTGPVTYYLVIPMLPNGSNMAVDSMVSFCLGLLSQKLIAAILEHGPAMFSWVAKFIVRRITGGN